MDNPDDAATPVAPTSVPDPVLTPQAQPTQPTPQSFAPRKEAGPAEAKAVVGEGGKSLDDVFVEADKVAKEENDEYWGEFAEELKAQMEVKDAGGMEKIQKGDAVVTPELAAEMGIKPMAPPEQGTDKNNFSVRGVSFSDEQITIGMKQPAGRGIRWLVEWFVLQLQRARFHIKKNWGGVVERSL